MKLFFGQVVTDVSTESKGLIFKMTNVEGDFAR
jgi:hypothetical protein